MIKKEFNSTWENAYCTPKEYNVLCTLWLETAKEYHIQGGNSYKKTKPQQNCRQGAGGRELASLSLTDLFHPAVNVFLLPW